MIEPLDPSLLAYGLQSVSDPQISPDGTRIVYLVVTADPSTRQPLAQVWLCDADGAHRRAFVTPDGAAGVRWSPDGHTVAFSAGGGRSLYLSPVDPDGPAKRIAHHVGSVSGLEWSPDGRRIAYCTACDPNDPNASADPDADRAGANAPTVRVATRIDYKQDGRGFVGDSREHVFVVDLAGGEPRRISDGPLDHQLPRWSPDGRWLAVEVPDRRNTGVRVVLLDVESGARRAVSPKARMAQLAAWSPGGERLFYACDLDRSFHPDYFVFDLARGDTRRLTRDRVSVPSGFGAPSPPLWLDERHVLVNTVAAGASGLEVVDSESGSVRVVQREDSRASGMSLDRRRRHVVQCVETPGSPGEVSVLDLETGVQTTVSAHNRVPLKGRPTANWERFTVTREGMEIESWLLKPPDFDPARSYPVILDIHGGPNGFHGCGFVAHQQCLATNGFLVVCPNPRGSTSYGGGFARMVLGDWGGGDFHDVLAVLDAVLEKPFADDRRVGIYGYSYGGYLTAWTISQTTRFAAAVCGAPIFDLESDYGTSDVAFNGLERHWGGPPHART
ncbi:MAG: alpha/beta hydrolase family protein, partial [Acidimicrobiales bacterium]